MIVDRRRVVRKWPALLAGLVALSALFLASPASRAVGGLGENPHDEPDACATCHDVSSGPPTGAVPNVVTLCRSCHPTADMHPVGMIPKNIHVVDGWPLEGGAVTCATCHANPTCDAARSRTAPYLRDGTPERRMDFCYRCHEPTKFERSNPHVPPPGGEAGTCSACHSGVPTADAHPEQSRLRLAPDKVCETCHPGPPHGGAIEHVGKAQTAQVPSDMAGKLPRLDDGTIECWTCHDVHATHDNPKLLALPTDGGSLCRACHGAGPP